MILEGWCVGCPPIKQDYLYSNINYIEKNYDKDKKWRDFYNNNLKKKYANLYKRFDSIIYLKPPSFLNILKWRTKQENYLKKLSKNKLSKGMSNQDIRYFIQHYEKITKWMMKIMPLKANLTLFINQDQKITSIRKKLKK